MEPLTREQEENRKCCERINAILGSSFDNLSEASNILHKRMGMQLLPTIKELLGECRERWIVHSLIHLVAGMKGAYDATFLAELFDRTPESAEDYELRWQIASTLEGYGSNKPQHISEWLIQRVRDPSIGKPKEMLILSLKHVPKGEAMHAAMEVFDEHPGHAAITIGKMADVSALPFLESKLLESEERHWFPWIRKEIETAIKRIEKRDEKRRLKGMRA